MTLKAPPIAQKDPIAREANVWVATLRATRPNGLRCHYCGDYANTRDHVVPKYKGGRNDWWNLVQCCTPCNQTKGNALPTCRCVFCVRAIRLWLGGNHAESVKTPVLMKTEIRQAKHGWYVAMPVTDSAKFVSYWPTQGAAFRSISGIDIPLILG